MNPKRLWLPQRRLSSAVMEAGMTPSWTPTAVGVRGSRFTDTLNPKLLNRGLYRVQGLGSKAPKGVCIGFRVLLQVYNSLKGRSIVFRVQGLKGGHLGLRV